MHFPIVKEYRTDLKGTLPDNEVPGEHFYLAPETKARVVVPVKSPFFVNSLRVTSMNGEPMILDQDYRIFQIMAGLTEKCEQEVSCMIEIINPLVTDGLMYYDVVGEFSLFDRSFMNLIIAAVNDDRPVHWDNLHNKPVWFRPKWHTHSILYDIVAFKDVLSLVNNLLAYLKINGRHLISVRMDHVLNLVENYISVFSNMLTEYLNNHEGAYDAHGLTAAQVQLEKVDNFATADEITVLQPRTDLHVTPAGLGSIIENYGFVPENFLLSKELPISQYGNTNFIPPGIDGSYEGLGSRSEAAGICLEGDGSVVFIGNRMDGRVNALYYSVISNYQSPSPTMEFSGFRYNHPKFIADGTTVDVIAQGSGKDLILVGDSIKNRFYIGVTNGTFNPAKHVYCRIDLSQLMAAVTSDPTKKLGDFFKWVSIVKIGDWAYIVFSHTDGSRDSMEGEKWGNSVTYKYFYRVSISAIRQLNDLTPARVNVTYTDMDGVRWNNASVWRWGTRQTMITPEQQLVTTKFIFNFNPFDDRQARADYNQITLAAENPDAPGTYALKFMSYYYAANSDSGKGQYAQLEIVYDFNPNTNTMNIIAKSPQPDVNWYSSAPPFDGLQGAWAAFTTANGRATCEVLDDGFVIGSATYTYTSFPQASKIARAAGIFSRYSMISKIWVKNLLTAHGGNPLQPVDFAPPPVESNVNPRPPFPFPNGEAYIATTKENSAVLGTYWKPVTGKYEARPGISNIFIPNVIGRPLSSSIKKLNVSPSQGAATVSMPLAQMNARGIEVGGSAFCTGVQRKYYDRAKIGTAWGDSGGQDDVLLIDTHNIRSDANGTMSLVPMKEILYPASIVARLKDEVEFKDAMNVCPKVFVTITDPSGYLTGTFGWLPTIVMVTYGETNEFTRHTTLLTIAPVYNTGNPSRWVVTDYEVLDFVHLALPQRATLLTANSWDAWVTGQNIDRDGSFGQAPMRTLFYKDGNKLEIFMDPAIQCDVLQDVCGTFGGITYDDVSKEEKKWTNGYIGVTQVNQVPKCVTPDNGISDTYTYPSSTGGAAIIADGKVNKPMLASVYPEIGFTLYIKSDQYVVFKGQQYFMARGFLDLRNYDSSPSNKTFYIYAALRNGAAVYEITTAKRYETPEMVWVGTAVTNATQIVTVDRFNVLTMDGHRVSEVKRGNSIPASSGLTNEEGQIPWLRSGEMLP